MNKKAAWFRIRSVIGSSNAGLKFLHLFTQSAKRKRLFAGSETDICIEGYPRCANTFSVLAFEAAQEVPLKIAHHMHLAGQVLYSIGKGIPVIVLIREPLDACISMHMREPDVDVELCLLLYAEFYKPLLPYMDQFIVARFDQVTSNYAPIIKRLNQRFSTEFRLYQNSKEHDEAVFELISQLPIKESKMSVAKPTAEKQQKKQALMEQFSEGRCAQLLSECTTIYEEFSKYA
jgi:hypothetical protein